MSSRKAFSNATILVVSAIALSALLGACFGREALAPEAETPTPETAEVSPLYEPQDVKALANTLADEYYPVWSPDGSKIYFRSGSEIYVSKPDGSQREKLAELGESFVFGLDMKSVFYTKTISSGDKKTYRAYVMDLASKNQEEIAELTLGVEYADEGSTNGRRLVVHDIYSWSPDRTKIFFTKQEETGYNRVWREEEEKWMRYKVGTEPTIPVLPDYYYDPSGVGVDLKLIDREYEETAWIWDLKDNELRFVGHLSYSKAHEVFGGGVVWSPDGRYVALPSIELSEAGAVEQVFVVNVETGESRRLTSFVGVNTSPEWSLDSGKIMYVRMPPEDGRLPYLGDRAVGADIWVVDVDGSNEKQLTDTAESWEEGYWSPDGSKIVYASWETGFSSLAKTPEIEIWMMSADGSDKRLLAVADGFVEHIEWSPDGSKMALVKQVILETDTSGFSILKLPSGEQVKPETENIGFHRDLYLIDVPE